MHNTVKILVHIPRPSTIVGKKILKSFVWLCILGTYYNSHKMSDKSVILLAAVQVATAGTAVHSLALFSGYYVGPAWEWG